MSTCAVCQQITGLVVNVIVADQSDPAPENCFLVVIPEGVMAGIGWTWDGQQFIAPPEVV